MTLYAIGDIQGCRGAFDALLEAILFDPGRDRLWLVGDLVNRGPDSLGVLRAVIALGDSATTVLGNHELHLLATSCGAREAAPNDSFGDILDAADAPSLIDWLRQRPLIHHDAAANRVLVHAGVPPRWDLDETIERAADVSAGLQSDDWRRRLADIYRASRLAAADARRARETIDALTRMRFCDRRGYLDFEHSGPPGTQPAHLLPWFDVPGRRSRTTHIVFGHWAALGILRRDDISALDSGCVWGGALTALPLTPPGEPTAVRCASGAVARRTASNGGTR